MFLLGIAGQIRGNFITPVGAEQFTMLTGAFEDSPKYETFFVTGHCINRQPNPVTDQLRFFILRKSFGQCFAVELVLTQRLNAFNTIKIDNGMVFAVENVNGQITVHHDGILHFFITIENDFALKAAYDTLFFGQHFRFPDTGHVSGPLRTIPIKRVGHDEFLLLRDRLRTTATGHRPGNDQQSEDHQTQQERQVFPSPFAAGSFLDGVSKCFHGGVGGWMLALFSDVKEKYVIQYLYM